MALLTGASATLLLRGDLRPRLRALDVPVLLFLLLAVLSALASPGRAAALRGLQLLLAYGGAYALASRLLRGRRSVLAAGTALAVLGSMLAVAGLLARGASLLGLRTFSGPDHRLAFTFASPDHFAGFLGMSACLVLGAALARPGRRRAPLLALALLVEVALVLTGSRGGLLAHAAGIAILAALLLASPARRSAALLVAALLVLGALLGTVLAPRVVRERLRATLTSPATVDPVRIAMWRATLDIVRSRPLLGVGPGLFAEAFSRVEPEAVLATQVRHAHSDWLELPAELGVPGLLAALLGVFRLFTYAVPRLLRAKDRAVQGAGLGALGATATALLHATVEFSLAVPANALLLVTGAALAQSAARVAAGEVEPDRVLAPGARATARARWAAALVTILGLAALAAVLAPWVAKRVAAGASRRLAYRDLPGALELQALARRIDPWDAELASGEGAMEAGAAVSGPPAERARHLDAAARAHGDALRLCPLRAADHVARAGALRSSGRADEAEADLRRALDLAPRSAIAHLGLGALLLERGQDEEARRSLRRALDIDPGLLPRALDELAELGVLEEMAADVVPASGPAIRALAAELGRRGDGDGAARELERAYALAPSPDAARAHLRALRASGHADLAAQIAPAYLARHPGDHALLAEAIEADQVLEQPDRAIERYRALLALDPLNPGYRLGFAAALRRAGRCGEALPVLEEAIRLAPGDVRLLLEAARCGRTLGDDASALLWIQRAVALQPADAAAHQALAEQLLRMNRAREAAAEYAKCVEIDPERGGCRESLRALGAR